MRQRNERLLSISCHSLDLCSRRQGAHEIASDRWEPIVLALALSWWLISYSLGRILASLTLVTPFNPDTKILCFIRSSTTYDTLQSNPTSIISISPFSISTKAACTDLVSYAIRPSKVDSYPYINTLESVIDLFCSDQRKETHAL